MADYIQNPVDIYAKRSAFPIHERHLTTMPFGKLIPLYCEEVIPGDTWNCDLRQVIRIVSPFVNATYGDLFFDAFAFFVPMRLVWEHTKQFFGENDSGAWTQSTQYSIPMLSYDNETYKPFHLCDYFNVNCSADDDYYPSFSALPLRAYYLIWNNFFRDENTQSPVVFSLGDTASDISYDVAPLDVCRYHDYFSSCLPGPQKGDAVTLISGLNQFFPLSTTSAVTSFHSTPILSKSAGVSSSWDSLGLRDVQANGNGLLAAQKGSAGTPSDIVGSNLGVNVSTPTINVNDLRYSVAVQRYLEKLARGGSRYNERMRAIYGVTVDDTTAQIPVRLGGYHTRISYSQIYQTSSTASDTTAQGHPVLYGMSNGQGNIINRSFVEPGYILVLGCVRQKHVYNRTLRKMWTKSNVLELWNPGFSFLGEQAVHTSEIDVAHAPSADAVFGYQAYGQEYRDFPDFVTGGLRPDIGAAGIPTFTMADNYSSAPTLAGFMPESQFSTNVTRALALQDTNNLFACDFNLLGKVVRPMPVYGIPGLVDHY